MLFNLLTFTVLIITNSFPWQLSLYSHTGELLLYRHSCLAVSSSSGAIIRTLGWSLSSQHTPGQSRLSSSCSATMVNSLLFYTIDLLPPSPNIQVFVELLSCSTRGLSALLLRAWCRSQPPYKLPTELLCIEALYTLSTSSPRFPWLFYNACSVCGLVSL